MNKRDILKKRNRPNRRNTGYYTILIRDNNGNVFTVSQLSKKYGIPEGTIRRREEDFKTFDEIVDNTYQKKRDETYYFKHKNMGIVVASVKYMSEVFGVKDIVRSGSRGWKILGPY